MFKPKNQKIKEGIHEHESIIYPPKDNCLIIIDDEVSNNIQKMALIQNMKSIQEQIKEFVLVVITED